MRNRVLPFLALLLAAGCSQTSPESPAGKLIPLPQSIGVTAIKSERQPLTITITVPLAFVVVESVALDATGAIIVTLTDAHSDADPECGWISCLSSEN